MHTNKLKNILDAMVKNYKTMNPLPPRTGSLANTIFITNASHDYYFKTRDHLTG